MNVEILKASKMRLNSLLTHVDEVIFNNEDAKRTIVIEDQDQNQIKCIYHTSSS